MTKLPSRMLAMVDRSRAGVARWFHPPAPERRAVDVNTVVRLVSVQFATSDMGRDHALSLELSTSGVASVDAGALRSVLWTLLDTATRHTPSGEAIRLEVVEHRGGLRFVIGACRFVPEQALSGAGEALATARDVIVGQGGNVTFAGAAGAAYSLDAWLPWQPSARAI